MINNKYMYDITSYIKAAKALTQIEDPAVYNVLESALRNQCILCTGTDLGEPLSFNDFILAGKIKEVIK